MVRLSSMNGNSGLDHFVSPQNEGNVEVTENKSYGTEMNPQTLWESVRLKVPTKH